MLAHTSRGSPHPTRLSGPSITPGTTPWNIHQIVLVHQPPALCHSTLMEELELFITEIILF